MPEDKNEAVYKIILDNIPESFWKGLGFWRGPYGCDHALGRLDGAERRRIILRVLEEIEKYGEEAEKHGEDLCSECGEPRCARANCVAFGVPLTHCAGMGHSMPKLKETEVKSEEKDAPVEEKVNTLEVSSLPPTMVFTTNAQPTVTPNPLVLSKALLRSCYESGQLSILNKTPGISLAGPISFDRWYEKNAEEWGLKLDD